MPSYKYTINGKKPGKTTTRWYCKFYYTDYTGKKVQKCKRGFTSQKDADKWEKDFLDRLQGSPEMPFLELYKEYIEDARARMRPSTFASRENVIKNHILPYFKDKPVNAITSKDVRKWQNDLMGKDYSPAYLDRINNALVTIFNYAVKYCDLPANPCDKAGHMGKRIRSMTFWTLDQYRAAIETVNNPTSHVALQILFYSGMRYGEMLALTPADIDYENNTISINKNCVRLEGKDYIGAPKTDNGFRTVHMPAAIIQEIRDYTARIYGINETDRIFTFSKTQLRNAIKRASTVADVPKIRIHDLRHSHVSMLIDMGFNPHLIADRIGDTVQMVNNTYGHLYPNKAHTVADYLDKLF